MPLRLALSAWLTPWFARVFIVRIANLFKTKKVNRNAVTVGKVNSK